MRGPDAVQFQIDILTDQAPHHVLKANQFVKSCTLG
jgi:hypothetical protein